MSSPHPEEGGFFDTVVTHPVAVIMVFLAALVFGYTSYNRLAVELMPDIAYPTITVRTVYDGAAPQEVESQVSRPVEEALSTLDGLVRIESRSRAGSSDVVIGFDWGTDMSAASQTIRENLQTTFLPEGTDRPLILRYDPSLDPFVRLVLSWEDAPDVPRDVALYQLRELADNELKREIESVKGVAAVRVRGGLEREIRVQLREDWMAARKVTLDMVRSALASENVNIAGGSVLEGDTEYLIRTLNEYDGARDITSLRIRRSDGVLVPLQEVAVLVDGFKEREVVSRLNAGEAVELEIFKEADANVVEVARKVKTLLEGNGVPKQWGGNPGLKGELPSGMALNVLDDQAAFIESAVNNLRDTAVVGGFFAVAVLFLFLRDFRATGIIGLAIPVSVVVGFAPLYLQGISLNLMSLGGLALGVGMLVDNAVVVLESIQRYRDEGLQGRFAAARGAADVAAAVTASTLTTVAVFLPITFVEGVAGELFGDLSLAVVSSLIASLVVALALVPTLAALDLSGLSLERATGALELVGGGTEGFILRRWWRAVSVEPLAQFRQGWAWIREGSVVRFATVPWMLVRLLGYLSARALWVTVALFVTVAARLALLVGGLFVVPARWFALKAADLFQSFYGRLAGRYTGWLQALMVRPFFVLGSAVVLFAVSLSLTGVLGTALIPEIHQGRFTVEAALPVGTPLSATDKVMQRLERVVASHPDVATVYTAVGVDKRADTNASEGEHTARLRIQLTPGGDLESRETRVMEELRGLIAAENERGLEVKMSRPALFSFRTPVEVVLYGYDLGDLRQVGGDVAASLSTVPGLRDVKSSLVDGNPEIRIRYDRARLHRMGLDPNTVAQRVRNKVQGIDATEVRQGDRRVALKVQLAQDDRSTLDDIQRINVNPNLVPAIPLDAVADFEEAVGPSEIRRVDQQRAVVVAANVEGFDLGSVAGLIEAALRDVVLPEGVTWEVAGQSQEMKQSLGSLQFALLLAVFLVYVIMASTFEHLLHPLVILFSVPLALIGVVPSLFLTGDPISVVVFIGLIVLAGVVVNNAIVLVDTINRLRSDGLSLDAAVRKAGTLRLRPILITTATTVLGLLPLALGFGAGAEIQGPLAVTVIGGLLSSTLLTLVVIPTLYRGVAQGLAVQAPEADGLGENA